MEETFFSIQPTEEFVMCARPWCDYREVKEKIKIIECLELLGGNLSNFVQSGNGLHASWTGPCPLPIHRQSGLTGHRNHKQFRIDSPGRDCTYDLFHCFSPDHEGIDAEVGGDVVKFVQLMTGLSVQHVGVWFKDAFPTRLSAQKSTHARRHRNGTASVVTSSVSTIPAAPQSNAPVVPVERALKPMDKPLAGLEPNHPYLAERGIGPATIARYQIGYCRRGVMARHIALPVYGHEQHAGEPPLCYLGRRVDNDERFPKYKWGAKGFEKTKVLYGLREALQTDTDTLVVVEGAFDVFACHRAGFGQACAPVGVDLSDDQVSLLVQSGRKVVVMFDGDSSGLAAMRSGEGVQRFR